MLVRNTINCLRARLTTPAITVLLLTTLSAPLTLARTLVESDGTMYSLNAIGFAHIDFAEYEDKAKDITGVSFNEGFQAAKLALHLSSRLGQRVATFLETEVTANGEEAEIEVERVIVKYERKISLQNYIIDLDVGLGAGRSSHLEIVKAAGHSHHNDQHGNGTVEGREAFVMQVKLSPKSNRDLTVGASAWIGNLDAYQVEDTDEQIISVHLAYQMKSGNFIAELAAVRHQHSDRADSNNNHAGYIQYNRRLKLAEGRLSPYVRLDYLDIDQQL